MTSRNRTGTDNQHELISSIAPQDTVGSPAVSLLLLTLSKKNHISIGYNGLTETIGGILMEKKKIILDVDTGSDDAIAIVCALLSNEAEVLGITTVGGNLKLENVTDNTLRVLECCGRTDIGVYEGSSKPLVSTLVSWSLQAQELERSSGVNDLTLSFHPQTLPLPKPSIRKSDRCALVWMIETLLACEENSVTIVATAPTTNIALAVRACPDILKSVREIVIMGGTDQVIDPMLGVKFNVWCDPEALEIILQSGANVLMIPFDATADSCLSYERAESIRSIGTAPAILVADLIEQRLKASEGFVPVNGKDVCRALHDALAVCAALHPEVIREIRSVSCHVDIGRGICYGETAVNRASRLGTVIEPNCRFAYGADTDLFFMFMYRILKEDKERRGVRS